VLPAQQTADGSAPGGFGLVMGTAARGIAELTGWTPRAPLSGQRCLTRRAFELASPLAAGWGVEVGMTIDILRAGLKVEEIDIDLRHRATGSDLSAQLHRAKQLKDVTRALAARGLVQAGLKDFQEAGGVGGLFKKLKR
jgi:glucosyl-3-phosphoglycerate synthase